MNLFICGTDPGSMIRGFLFLPSPSVKRFTPVHMVTNGMAHFTSPSVVQQPLAAHLSTSSQLKTFPAETAWRLLRRSQPRAHASRVHARIRQPRSRESQLGTAPAERSAPSAGCMVAAISRLQSQQRPDYARHGANCEELTRYHALCDAARVRQCAESSSATQTSII